MWNFCSQLWQRVEWHITRYSSGYVYLYLSPISQIYGYCIMRFGGFGFAWERETKGSAAVVVCGGAAAAGAGVGTGSCFGVGLQAGCSQGFEVGPVEDDVHALFGGGAAGEFLFALYLYDAAPAAALVLAGTVAGGRDANLCAVSGLDDVFVRGGCFDGVAVDGDLHGVSLGGESGYGVVS